MLAAVRKSFCKFIIIQHTLGSSIEIASSSSSRKRSVIWSTAESLLDPINSMTYKHKNEVLLISSFFHLAIVSVDIYVVRIESKSFFERMKLRHSNYFTMSKPCRDSLIFGGFDINGYCIMLGKNSKRRLHSS